MDKDTRVLQSEIIRIRQTVDTLDYDFDDINNDIVLINQDIETLKNTTQSLDARVGTLEQEDNELIEAVNQAQSDISSLNMDIERLDTDINNADTRIDDLERKEDERAHYLGAFQTTAELNAYPTPTSNDFADNYETSTRWIYTAGAWVDSEEPIPTDATILGNTAPLMNGSTSAGTATMASRTDHVHPTDTSLVPITRTINNKVLSQNVMLQASDVNAVPVTRRVNSKELRADITLTAADISAGEIIYEQGLQMFFDITRDDTTTRAIIYPVIYTTTSTAIRGLAAFAEYLYNNGFTTNLKCLQVIAKPSGVGITQNLPLFCELYAANSDFFTGRMNFVILNTPTPTFNFQLNVKTSETSGGITALQNRYIRRVN